MNIGQDLNDLLNNAIALQKKQRIRTVVAVLLIATIGIALFFYSNIFTAKTVKEEIQKDSIITNAIYKKVAKKQNDDVKMIIEDYFNARVSKNVDSIAQFYADTTFDYYYSYPNQFQKNIPILSKKEVLRIEKVDFRKKDNRIFEYTEFLTFSENLDESWTVLVKGKQFSKGKMYDAILEIKLKGSPHKIYSIRPYIDTFRKM
ncbi:MAG: hypothetical protein MUF58_02995 [Arcicella sp.]|jgi:hypothetical protein|nr:hypothetical protein [Arcicella sp.]